MTKLSEVFEVLYESDLMPIADGEVIILPNVALSRVTDLKSKLGALESGIEPLGYNRYELILPDEIDMEVEEDEIPEESDEEVKDSAEDKSEEKDSEEKSEEPKKEDSKEDEKMSKAVDEICDIITDWIGAKPVNESAVCPECGENPCVCEDVCPECGENPCVCEEDLSEVMDQMTECGSKPSFRKNELASYLESFAGPNEIYEAQEDEYIEDEAPKAEEKKEKPVDQKTISDYLTSEAEDIIDITEPAEKQALIDLLVHNKEVLWGPTSAKIQSFRSELESLDDSELESKADDIFPEWRKHIKKYIVEPKPVENMPAEDEAPVEEIEEPIEEQIEEVPEAAEEFQPDPKPDEQILTEEPFDTVEDEQEYTDFIDSQNEENEEINTEEVVRKGFEVFGNQENKEEYEKAIKIVTQWYENEGGLDIRMSPEVLKNDIIELIDAASNPEEIKTVGAVIGLDPDVLPDFGYEEAENAD